MKSLLALAALIFAFPVWAVGPVASPLSAQQYASQLGIGMNVDWARTERGIREFDPLAVRDFHNKGISHVRIRVAGDATEPQLIHLRKIVEACDSYGVIPIIAYQADAFKNDPNAETSARVVAWWSTVARYFADRSPLLGFDLIYEPGEKLNHNLPLLNRTYEKSVRVIHAVNDKRMIFIAPRLHAAPEALSELKLPAQSSHYLLAEWHIFPWGPQKTNGKYPWTTGTVAEKSAIRARINAALHWQQKTGHQTWLGAWSAGVNSKTGPQPASLAFSTYVACQLQKARIPYAINADSIFYDGEEGAWRPALEPLLQIMINPECIVKKRLPGTLDNAAHPGGSSDITPAARAGAHDAPAAASKAGSANP